MISTARQHVSLRRSDMHYPHLQVQNAKYQRQDEAFSNAFEPCLDEMAVGNQWGKSWLRLRVRHPKRLGQLMFAQLLLMLSIVCRSTNALLLLTTSHISEALPGRLSTNRISLRSTVQPDLKWRGAFVAPKSTSSFPTFFASPSSSCCTTMKLAEANMFLSHPKSGVEISFPTLSHPRSTGLTDPLASSKILIRSRRRRLDQGILGFRVDDETDSTTTTKDDDCHVTSSSSLRASSSRFSTESAYASDFDERQWKSSGDQARDVENNLSWKSVASWSPETTRSRRRSSNNQALLESLSPLVPQSIGENGNKTEIKSHSYLQWLPNSNQIEKLSVIQLKQALADRGLPVSGNKSGLQQRLGEWSALQKQHFLDKHKQGELSSTSLCTSYGVGSQQQMPKSKQQYLSNDSKAADFSSDDAGNAHNLYILWHDDDNGYGSHEDIDDEDDEEGMHIANSLAEWTRTVDLQPLLQRRKAIHRELQLGKGATKENASPPRDEVSSLMSKEEYISVLKKVFDESSQSRYSNYEVKQMYAAAKEADQLGDRALSKRILTELKEVTPRDARLYRRLARMENEEGNIAVARDILREGLKMDPQNAYLWHGLAQMASSDCEAMEHYRKAIQCDPSLPMPYHALGTLQHTKGRIASAMKTLKEGLEYCPSNHRLHHALGDIYRDAKMLNMANKCYRKALKHGPTVSHGFAYNALAYVAYEDGDVEQCRSWLQRSVNLNDGRNANGWVSWAQMEEAEGNIDEARKVCINGIAKYERTLLKRASVRFRNAHWRGSSNNSASAIRNRLMTRVPVYRSGDRFFNLYRNWARLEERHGTTDSVSEVYRRAFLAFPTQWQLTIDWAHYHTRLNMYERATELFFMACTQSSGQHGDPYRCYAEYEMSRRNYEKAQEILLRGTIAFADATGGDAKDRNGMVELYYVWAVCEWHLANFARAEILFDHALKSLGEERLQMKSLILYAKAKLYHCRDEPLLAQHCIGLCLKENAMPAGTKFQVWDLWAEVAAWMDNDKLSTRCRMIADKMRVDENGVEGENLHTSTVMVPSARPPPDMEHLVRRDPWHFKIFDGSSKQRATSYERVRLPKSVPEQKCL